VWRRRGEVPVVKSDRRRVLENAEVVSRSSLVNECRRCIEALKVHRVGRPEESHRSGIDDTIVDNDAMRPARSVSTAGESRTPRDVTAVRALISIVGMSTSLECSPLAAQSLNLYSLTR